MLEPSVQAQCPHARPSWLKSLSRAPQWIAAALLLLFVVPNAFAQEELTLEQTVSTAVANGDGTYTAEIELRLENTGVKFLNMVRIEHDLRKFGPSGRLIGVGPRTQIDGNVTLSLNPDFNGGSESDVLIRTNTLDVGEWVTLKYSVTFDPGNETGPFTSNPIARGNGAESGRVERVEDPQPINLENTPGIRLTGSAGSVSPVDNFLGVPITLTIENTGSEDLRDAELFIDLDVFGSGSLKGIENLTGDGIEVNPGFTGRSGGGGRGVLEVGSRLDENRSATITFTIVFDPGDELQPFVFTGKAFGFGARSGGKVIDEASLSFLPRTTRSGSGISLIHNAGRVVDNGNGTRSVPIEMAVINPAEDQLEDVQISNFLNIFGTTGQLIGVRELVTSDNLTPNPAFDGSSDIFILSVQNVLPPGEGGTVSFIVDFAPGDEIGPFTSSATAEGTGSRTGQPVTDTADATFLAEASVDGPAISITNIAGDPTSLDDGKVSVPVRLIVTNPGTEDLVSVQITDDLDIFGSGQIERIENLTTTGLTVNDAYDGRENDQLLTGEDTLGQSRGGIVEFTAIFDPADEPGPFPNTATCTANGEESGTLVQDESETEFRLPVISPPPPPSDSEDVDLLVFKTSDSDFASRGDIVGYDITVTNLTTRAMTNVRVVDDPPGGFRLVDDSTRLVRFGPDGVLGTGDDIVSEIASNGMDPIEFEPFNLDPNETVLIRYFLRIGTGVADGEHTNEVTVTPDGSPPADGSSVIVVTPDPIFESTTVIGKVFHDVNENGYPDPGEEGLPGAMLATVGGLLIETDKFGRFHIADVEVNRFERGENYILKLDESSLPQGSEVLTENPRVIRMTQALMTKLNFGIKLPPPKLNVDCVKRCIVVTPRIETADVDPVRFPSGQSIIPVDFERQLTDLMDRYKDQRGVTLLFVGHTDTDPVFGRLAQVLGAGGAAGNQILSMHRARTVCRYVRDELGFAADCDNIEGRGQFEPVATNETEAGKALNRRVEIKIQYYEENREVLETIVSKKNCPDDAAEPVPTALDAWASLMTSEQMFDQPQTVCVTSNEPIGPQRTATAREIHVSGGEFGCHTLVDEVLPGRLEDEDPGALETVTVFAGEGVGRTADGTVCESNDAYALIDNPARHIPSQIIAGKYPIQMRTDAGSVLQITAAGDVHRIRYPSNDERIVVAPYRDESDSSEVTALRVTNEGVEPGPSAAAGLRGLNTGYERLFSSTDTELRDPRLDVLALDQAIVNNFGALHEPVEFAYFTNYSHYIKRYELLIYGRPREGFDRKLITRLSTTAYRFERPFVFDGDGFDLSGYSQIEYQLKAYDCEDPTQGPCTSDITKTRLLHLQGMRDAFGNAHERNELWGKNNLEVQRIPVEGSRSRISGVADPGVDELWVNQWYVPVGADRRFVLEQHLPDGDYDIYVGQTEADGLAPGALTMTADASSFTVSGGLFGCQQMQNAELKPSDGLASFAMQSLTVVADPAYRGVDSKDMPERCNDGEDGSFPIIVTTAEGSEIAVTAAGDVIRRRTADNNQQIVVTPYRDETDNATISALRVANEGAPEQFAGLPQGDREPDLIISNRERKGFLVAYGSLTVGQNNVSGSSEPLEADSRFDGSTFTEGRLALYGRGSFADKYHVTAQLDTTEDELRNLTDNLRRKDPRRIFRQLDTDHYYPVYGDDSTTLLDANSQGAMYLRMDWDNNTALWGNYNTGFVDTEFMQYNRSLYGAYLHHESQEATEFGAAKSELRLFGSEAQSATAHVTFRATGGSLYYLRNTDIVMGSEKLAVEVRRRDTQQVVERQLLFYGRDYEIDPIQGRIILSRPLSQVVADRGNAIIRSTPLEGDEVFLLVDYEYVPLAFDADKVSVGGRGKYWFNDNFAAGITAVSDEREGTDYGLQGIDLTWQATEGSYLKAEIAQSESRQSDANFISIDGGLNFTSQQSSTPDEDLDGDALALEGRINLADVTDSMTGDIRGWYKTRDAGYSTGRLDQGFDTNDVGFEAFVALNEMFNLTAAYKDFERENLRREQVTRVQADGTFGAFKAGLEVRHEDIEHTAAVPTEPTSMLNAAQGSGEATLVGGRIGYSTSEDTTVYATAQVVADDSGTYEPNDLFTLGVNTRLSDLMALSFEASEGDRGSALTAGFDVAASDGLNFNVSGGIGNGAVSQFSTRYAIAEGHELYGSYTVDPDRTDGQRNLLTMGQRSSFGNSTTMFAETQFGKDDRYASSAHVFGMNFDGIEDWRLSATLQFSDNDALGLQFERRAASVGAYWQKDDVRFSSRVEFREDIGSAVHTRQWITSNSLTHVLRDDSRWLTQLNLSWTDDKLNGGQDAKFAEFNLAYAFRPVLNDRFNMVAKYTFLFDMPTDGQATLRADERSHVLSVEGLYDLNQRWELGGKFAIKSGDRRLFNDTGPWFDFGMLLSNVRVRYSITNKWDGLAEYRWLKDEEGNNDRHGMLLGLYRNVGDHVKIGAGFNFTDFNDDLRIDDYDARGWFLDIIGKY